MAYLRKHSWLLSTSSQHSGLHWAPDSSKQPQWRRTEVEPGTSMRSVCQAGKPHLLYIEGIHGTIGEDTGAWERRPNQVEHLWERPSAGLHNAHLQWPHGSCLLAWMTVSDSSPLGFKGRSPPGFSFLGLWVSKDLNIFLFDVWPRCL